MVQKKRDLLFKKRFGIHTSIEYMWNVTLDPKCKAQFERDWKRFYPTTKDKGSKRQRKRFDAFLKKLEKAQDDAAFCKKIEIRYISRRVGFGVFARVNILPNEILNLYGGILRLDKAVDPDNDSAFTFEDFPKYSIDAMHAGNWTRFINHASEKKANVAAWEHFAEIGPRIIFTAGKKGIKKGSQLLYSYGDFYWDKDAFDLL